MSKTGFLLTLTTGSLLFASQALQAADANVNYGNENIDILYEEQDEFVSPVGYYNWSGLRGGLVGQYNTGKLTGEAGGNEAFSLKPKGGMFGASLSFDTQNSNIVYGAKASFIAGKAKDDVLIADAANNLESNYESETKLQFDLVGRVGMAMDKILIYGMGGIAHTNKELTYTITDTNGVDPDVTDTLKLKHTTWTIGVGAAIAFNDKISANVEYLYKPHKYDKEAINTVDHEFDHKTHAIRFGIDYRFR